MNVIAEIVRRLECGYVKFKSGRYVYVWESNDIPSSGKILYHYSVSSQGVIVTDVSFTMDHRFVDGFKVDCAVLDVILAHLPQPIAEEIIPEVYIGNAIQALALGSWSGASIIKCGIEIEE